MDYQDFLLKYKNNSQFQAYERLIVEKSKIMNLTAHNSSEGMWSHLFYDSYLPYCSLGENLNKLKILDIGSGAGFPGLVLKIMYPDLKLTIIEAQKKKCLFLQQVVDELALKDVEILNLRAEDLPNSSRELYDVATARAVARLNVLIEISAPFVKTNGLCIYPKGSQGVSELDKSKNAIEQLKLRLIDGMKIKSSATEMQHIVLIFKKTQKTAKIYPRKWVNIKQKPL